MADSQTFNSKILKWNITSVLGSLVGVLVSACVLVGWAIENAQMKSIFLNLPPMIPLTAISVLMVSLSLFFAANDLHHLRTREKFKLYRTWLSVFFGLLALGLGTTNLLGQLFQFDPGLRQLLMFQRVDSDQTLLFAGKMSIQTSAFSALLALVLCLRPFQVSPRAGALIQALPLVSFTGSLLACIAYIHNITSEGATKLIGMSLPSTIAFACLSVGILASERNVGLMKNLRSRESHGFFLRWYTLSSVLVPLFLTAIIAMGEHQDFYPIAFSVSIFVVFTIGSFFILGIVLSIFLRRLERQKLATQQAQNRAALMESEENLREVNERLQIALEASRMGTWESDIETEVSRWSNVTEQIFGLPPGGFKKTHGSFLELVHPEDLPAVVEGRAESLRTGSDFNQDFRCVWPNGNIRWIRCKARVKRDARGVPVKIGGTVMDVTDEKAHQEALEIGLKAAESANQLKTPFLTNMSHEIRTPLAAILGFTELLKDSKYSKEEKLSYLEVISRNGKTLSHLLNDILDLSKVESGHLNIEILKVRLRELIEEIFALLRKSAEEKNIFLTVHYAANAPLDLGSDPIRLKQILTNLVGNAIKFTSRGGVVLRVSKEGSKVLFEIEDSGIGISSEQQKKLFQSFSQADDSTTRRFGGTGLGLALSRRLALLLGGSVDLKFSQEGVGSVFLASVEDIPTSVKSQKVAEGSLLGTKSLEGLRILVAEDSIDNQKLISRLLNREGAEVDLAKDGEECYEKALQQECDIILMDIQMPVCDGYTATKKLRDAGFKKPILALTAHAMNDVREKCESVGCDGHLAKPIDKELLIRTLVNFTHPQ